MTRTLAICCMLCTATALVHADLVTYYEDHFDTGSLNGAWTAWGTGSYALVGSDLEFITEAGDFHPNMEPTYGVPHHLFLVSAPAGITQWQAVTRVRFNTPNQVFEQVNLSAFTDSDNSVKISYGRGNGVVEHVLLSEHNAAVPPQIPKTVQPYGDYFWMRLDREGDNYAAYFSGSGTTDPDAVNWSYLGGFNNALGDPSIGIGGWNGYSAPAGELAEFDYFRLQVVPEPSALAAAVVALLTLRSARRRA
jgi:hypothetical protein